MPEEEKQSVRGIGRSSKQRGNLLLGKSWFFGIGINRYQYFSNLNNAVKDVKDLLTLMQDRYDLESSQVVTLFDEKANRRNVIRTFDQLQQKINPEDKLLIYYSGHGHLMDTGQNKKGFWIPTDAEKDNTAQYIRNSTIREYIEDINSLHTLLISDSCFSGSLFVRGASRTNIAIQALEQRKSRWAICSGRHDEEVYDGEPGANSPFADSILNILLTNQLPKLNVAKLADKVVELTRANYRQLPEGNPLYSVGHKGGQYVFSLKTNEAAAWERAKVIDTIHSYYDYSNCYPSGKYQSEALAAIKQLEEAAAWEKALQSNTISAFIEYKNRYSQGRFVREAEEKIQALLNNQRALESKHQKSKAHSHREYNEPEEIEISKASQPVPPLLTKTEKKRIFTTNRLISAMTIGGAIFGAIFGATDGSLDRLFIWIFDGLFIGAVIKQKYTKLDGRDLFITMIGWLIGPIIGVAILPAGREVIEQPIRQLITGMIFGTVSGILTGFVIKRKYAKINWIDVLLITIGWLIGGATSSIIIWEIGGIAGWTVGGATISAIGGGVMFWRLHKIT